MVMPPFTTTGGVRQQTFTTGHEPYNVLVMTDVQQDCARPIGGTLRHLGDVLSCGT